MVRAYNGYGRWAMPSGWQRQNTWTCCKSPNCSGWNWDSRWKPGSSCGQCGLQFGSRPPRGGSDGLQALLDSLEPGQKAAVEVLFPGMLGSGEVDPCKQADKDMSEEARKLHQIRNREASCERRILRLREELAQAEKKGQELQKERQEAEQRFEATRRTYREVVEAKEQGTSKPDGEGKESMWSHIPAETEEMDGVDDNAGEGDDVGGVGDPNGAVGAATQQLLQAIPAEKRSWLRHQIEAAATPAGKRRKIQPHWGPPPGGKEQEGLLHALLRARNFRGGGQQSW